MHVCVYLYGQKKKNLSFAHKPNGWVWFCVKKKKKKCEFDSPHILEVEGQFQEDSPHCSLTELLSLGHMCGGSSATVHAEVIHDLNITPVADI